MSGIARKWTEEDRELAGRVVQAMAKFQEIKGCAVLVRAAGMKYGRKEIEKSKRKLQDVMPLAIQMFAAMHPGSVLIVDNRASTYAVETQTTERGMRVTRAQIRKGHTTLMRSLHQTLRDTPAGSYQAAAIGMTLAALESDTFQQVLNHAPAEAPSVA